MTRGDDRQLMTEEEFVVALADATAQELIEWAGDEKLRLTDKGVDKCMELREQLGGTDWIILTLLQERIREAAEHD